MASAAASDGGLSPGAAAAAAAAVDQVLDGCCFSDVLDRQASVDLQETVAFAAMGEVNSWAVSSCGSDAWCGLDAGSVWMMGVGLMLATLQQAMMRACCVDTEDRTGIKHAI
jgi:hypothetical protein